MGTVAASTLGRLNDDWLIDQLKRLRRVLKAESGYDHVIDRYEKDEDQDDVVEHAGDALIFAAVYVQAADDHKQDTDYQLRIDR